MFLTLLLDAPFVLFHVSVLVCILRKIRLRDKVFSQCFFVVYVQQSIIELLSYALVSFRSR